MNLESREVGCREPSGACWGWDHLVKIPFLGWYPLPTQDHSEPRLPRNVGLPPSDTRIWSRGLRCFFFFCRSQRSEGLQPSAPTPGPPRGPHPSWSFKGKQPQTLSQPRNADPQFRRREPRLTGAEAGRGQQAVSRADWLRGGATSRKPRRATSSESQRRSQFPAPPRERWSSWWG